PARRHRARRRPDSGRADRSAVLDPRRPRRLPRRPRDPPWRHPGRQGSHRVTAPAVAAPRPGRAAVRRWTLVSRAAAVAVATLGVALIFVPVGLGSNATQKLTSLLILVILAAMWNALAGFGGLVSIGQQAFIGLGAYGTVYFVHHGIRPYMAMLAATVACGIIAVLISLFALRLRAAQF